MLQNRKGLFVSCLALVAAWIHPCSPLALGADHPKLPVIRQKRDSHPSGHRRLSNPLEMLKPHYRFLVVGSGYGASVPALRIPEALNQGGQRSAVPGLAVFERGKEWLPGDFPDKGIVDVAGLVRGDLNPLGLVATHTHGEADMDVIGASGLGGTSLLNAAIAMRAPDNVWRLSAWPKEIRDDFESGKLNEYFERAEEMLLPNKGPKTSSQLKAKAHLGNFPWRFPKGELSLNINHEEGRTRFGVSQHACTSCGNCCGGCNVGAKNTLTTNYLAAAKDLGAEIYTQIEVTRFAYLGKNHPSGARYEVFFKSYYKDDGMLGMTRTREGSVLADNLFLGAGSAGTTQLLLRSRAPNFLLSPRIGMGVSANGDVLGFVYNGKKQTNIAANPDTASLQHEASSVGPTITVYGDFRQYNKNRPIEEQFVLLDGAVPAAFSSAVAQGLAALVGPQFLTSASGLSRVAKDLLNPSYPPRDGALNHSMLLLACGHDSCGGRYVLDEDGSAYVVWPNMQDEDSFRYISAQMEKYAERMGGKFIPNPRSTFFGGGKLQATHPLGGAIMADSIDKGVVDHEGRVFNPDGGVYPGLRLVDASVLSHSLAAPPLITITGNAERIVERFVRRELPNLCEDKLNPQDAGE